MTTPGEDFPGAGLWSTTGHGPPSPRPSVSVEAADRSSVAPVVGQTVPTPPSPTTRVQAKTRTRCKCNCCGCDCCARCCCPCTCCRCFCWLCVTIVLFVLAVGIVVLVLWKVLDPKFPTYNVDNVEFHYSITGAGATNANSSSGPSSYVLNAQTVFEMQLGNPNTKIGIYYDQIKLNVKLFGLVIGNQIIPAFYDGFHVTKDIHVNMTSGPVILNAANQAALVAAENAGKVPLNLKTDVKVRVKLGSLTTPQLKVELNCVATIDPRISAGSQITNMKCKFKLLL